MKSITHVLRDERGHGAVEHILVLVAIVGLAWLVHDQFLPTVAADVTDLQQSLSGFQVGAPAAQRRSVVRRIATLGE